MDNHPHWVLADKDLKTMFLRAAITLSSEKTEDKSLKTDGVSPYRFHGVITAFYWVLIVGLGGGRILHPRFER
jgi:hypothetical protein